MRAIGCVWVMLAASLGAVTAADSATFCAVTAAEGGSALIERGGSAASLAPGALAGTDGVIATGPGTRLQLTCDDGTVVTVGPDSRVDLADLLAGAADGPSIVVRLLEGIAGFVAPERAGFGFEVHTPVAVAAVRSTEWLVEHVPDTGATSVFARSGTVAVSNATAEFVLTPGEGITLGRDMVIRPLARWGQARIEQTTGALGFGWD